MPELNKSGVIWTFVRFLISGFISVGTVLSVFLCLSYLDPQEEHLLGIYVFASIIGLIVGFLMQRKFVWATEVVVSMAILRYAVSNLAYLFLNLVVIYTSVYKLGLAGWQGAVVASAVTITLNFFVSKYWTFKGKKRGMQK